jgi:hypothetical protein
MVAIEPLEFCLAQQVVIRAEDAREDVFRDFNKKVQVEIESLFFTF